MVANLLPPSALACHLKWWPLQLPAQLPRPPWPPWPGFPALPQAPQAPQAYALQPLWRVSLPARRDFRALPAIPPAALLGDLPDLHHLFLSWQQRSHELRKGLTGCPRCSEASAARLQRHPGSATSETASSAQHVQALPPALGALPRFASFVASLPVTLPLDFELALKLLLEFLLQVLGSRAVHHLAHFPLAVKPQAERVVLHHAPPVP
mmetsp:Transcript_7664/g.17334  ORF Transcript_7664/g.17334 Transcript_7664/m.17334 type:complete len:209 (-) Transcript_7664:996-1622(-)